MPQDSQSIVGSLRKEESVLNNTIDYCLYESVTNPINKKVNRHIEVVAKRHNIFELKLFSKYLMFRDNHIFGSILSSFSIQVNFKSLTMSRRNDEEHEEMEVLEGMRSLSMFWGIFTATSLYVLVAHVWNIYEMLRLFESITFTMVASGNLTPDFFLFTGFFLGFVKLNHLYDVRNGISPLLYIKIIFYRFAKIAPIYYFVFFLGWSIFPFLSNADTWYMSQTLFQE